MYSNQFVQLNLFLYELYLSPSLLLFSSSCFSLSFVVVRVGIREAELFSFDDCASLPLLFLALALAMTCVCIIAHIVALQCLGKSPLLRVCLAAFLCFLNWYVEWNFRPQTHIQINGLLCKGYGFGGMPVEHTFVPLRSWIEM